MMGIANQSKVSSIFINTPNVIVGYFALCMDLKNKKSQDVQEEKRVTQQEVTIYTQCWYIERLHNDGIENQLTVSSICSSIFYSIIVGYFTRT